MSSKSSRTGGYVDPSWPPPNPLGPDDAPIIIYGYLPSFALALVGIVLFTIACIGHTVQVVHYRCYYFIPVAIGCLFEVVGYIFRSLSSKVDPYRVQYFVVQYFFIVVAPVLFSASIYAILSVLIARTGPQFSPLPPGSILWTFVISDILATVIQIVGSALIGVSESHRKDPTFANNILLGGLAVQVFSFLFFVLLYSAFLWQARSVLFTMRKAPTVTLQSTRSYLSESEDRNPTNKRSDTYPLVPLGFLVSLSIATLAVYMRTCYRLSETAQYNYGSRAHNVKEAYFGGLEFAPIIVCVYLLSLWHPGRCLAGSKRIT